MEALVGAGAPRVLERLGRAFCRPHVDVLADQPAWGGMALLVRLDAAARAAPWPAPFAFLKGPFRRRRQMRQATKAYGPMASPGPRSMQVGHYAPKLAERPFL